MFVGMATEAKGRVLYLIDSSGSKWLIDAEWAVSPTGFFLYFCFDTSPLYIDSPIRSLPAITIDYLEVTL